MQEWIVVVDDEALSLTNARKLLTSQGMKVSCMRSGQDMLRFMEKNEPDLILLDIMMPERDGFEALRLLREQEKKLDRLPTPVIFLTGDEDAETERRGLAAGASDFIRKPFDREILVSRINNTVKNGRMIENLVEEASIDKLTGFLNKSSGTEKISALCEKNSGALIVLDLDSFKLVNDLFGHDMGDKVLGAFADIVRRSIRENDVASRIGGDEFMLFMNGMEEVSHIEDLVKRLNDLLTAEAEKLMGEDFGIPLGISAGVVFVPEFGTDYPILFQYADSSLYRIKQNGKHGYEVYSSHTDVEDSDNDLGRELIRVTRLVEERGAGKGAMILGQDAFSANYRFIVRFLKRYKAKACKMLFAVDVKSGEAQLADAVMCFEEILQENLRRTDIIFQSRQNRFFLLLPEMGQEAVDIVVGRIMAKWEKTEYSALFEVRYTAETIDFNEGTEGSEYFPEEYE